MKTYICLTLHSHLPFVRHPEHPSFLQEDWLFEGITETYLPLLYIFERMREESIDFRLTINISPTLSAMLSDSLLQKRYNHYLNKLIDLIAKEKMETARTRREFHNTVLMYSEKFTAYKKLFKKFRGNILDGFKGFMESGNLELITSPATHTILPLVKTPNARSAQVKTAVKSHKHFFGRQPNGMWLPECAYTYGIEDNLADAGIKYFFMETHGILFAKPRPRHGVYSPVLCPNNLIALGRDIETTKQVWSAQEGYPGDYDYREFYRDIGYDADYEYILPYLHSDGIRRSTGIKYYKITGKCALGDKQPYEPDAALAKTKLHAENFLQNRKKQADFITRNVHFNPILIAPYDTELFGHWWFEGIDFLYHLFKSASNYPSLKFATVPQYLEENYGLRQKLQPAISSWGNKGFFEMWVNSSNDWVYRHLHQAELKMIKLASANKNCSDTIKERFLNQAARELMLAQSSDWAFMMTTGQDIPYSEKRFKTHINNFNQIVRILDTGEHDASRQFLEQLETADNLFPFIDFRDYV